ncbi:Gfo/Idh/MocA family protein [Phytoactinopolyspora halotolerans]|uniref:Gfo/Idh/MocA family oxidoreductase n=1 Tax=Phytoactinopolyspora halotolerans TaxID=1981512 RepID=A0A6L9SF19_9ACTN|nr:Gfo/Idh/MocA family oxidoreductase [Phytoactinopolyspora halotolerans]NEE03188.1 Gfo/Idh/MocA family oxidoreductase [Phytoactinopolyspora halotolerans]
MDTHASDARPPITIAVVGAGNRGRAYARWAAASGKARIVAVADPDPARQKSLGDEAGVPADRLFDGWQELAAVPRVADAAVIATQDTLHVEPSEALARAGYHILLEKPMATTEQGAQRILAAVRQAGVRLAVCHVLRYMPYTQALRRIIDSGQIGEIVSVEHLEPVGWWHQAHSYVRGNWRREADSSPMLLAKSVHDLDWLNHMIGRRPARVASFGSLHHFRPEQRPTGAADNCLDCPIESSCPYSAPRLYLSCLGDPAWEDWPLSTVTDARTPAGVLDALRTGPYGRCVYDCDNDVVDHQVVSIEYEGGVTASFTMTAFTPHMFRQTRIFGTHGYLEGDGKQISLLDFRTRDRHVITTTTGDDATAAGGHGGGDKALVDAFVDAVAAGGTSPTLASPEDSYASHRLVWAAERARTTGSVVDLSTDHT